MYICTFIIDVAKLRLRGYILSVIIACAFGTVKTYAESPPLQQCAGGRSIFAVTGDSASTFRYSITGGVFLDTTRNDSIVVEWDRTHGLCTIGVQEISLAGCKGEWTYIEVDLKGTPFNFDNKEMSICPGESLQFDIDMKLYKNIKWSDPDVANRGITSPGNYQIWLECMDGCRYTDTVKVVTCE